MMRIVIIFLLCITTITAFSAEDEIIPTYKVEIIVFQHVYSEEPPESVNQVNDYRMVTRPERLPDEDELVDAETLEDSKKDIALTEESLQALPNEEVVWPPTVFNPVDFESLPEPEQIEDLMIEVAGPSEVMQRAWNRLLNSAAYRPLQYSGWEQHAYPVEEQRPVRVHDDVALPEPDDETEETIDPELALDPLERNQVTVPVVELVTGELALEEDAAADDETALEEEIDEAEFTSYRLDGQFSLVQRKFLHLSIDLEWREQAELLLQDIQPVLEFVDNPDAEELLPAWSLYSVLQRRQIHEDRLEYFDTPWLGVLALITEVEIPEMPEETDVTDPAEATSNITPPPTADEQSENE